MKKPHLQLVVALLAALGIVASSCRESGAEKQVAARTAAEPDLEHSIRFIGNLASLAGRPNFRDEVTFSAGRPCVATYASESHWQWIVDFSKLNPESVEIVGKVVVQVRTTNAELVIQYGQVRIVSGDSSNFDSGLSGAGKRFLASRFVPAMIQPRVSPRDQYEKTDTLQFHVGKVEDVPKVRDALSYVIHKCGGKGDLFPGGVVR